MPKNRFTALLLILSTVALVSIFALNRVYIYPKFAQMVIEDTRDDAARLAEDLASVLGVTGTEPKWYSLNTYAFVTHVDSLVQEDKLFKLKVFDNRGKILYSTDPADVGEVNKKSYFTDIVAKGGDYAKVVKKEHKSAEGQMVPMDVVEVYIPLVRDGKFLGAFEIYKDITFRMNGLHDLVAKSIFIMVAISLSFLAVAFVVSRKEAEVEEKLQSAHDQMARSERRLNSLIESSLDSIVATDPSGNVTTFNHGGEVLLGWSRKEVLGQRVSMLYESEETAKEVMRLMRSRGGSVAGFETELRAKDGDLVPVLISASILYDGEGNEAGTVGFSKDLRERKMFLKELYESNERYQTLVESSLDCIALLDLEGKIITSNKNAFRVLRPEGGNSIIGEKFSSLYPKPCRPDLEMAFDRALNHETGFFRIFTFTSTKVMRWWECSFIPVLDDMGRAAMILATARDITDRIKFEEKLKEREERHRSVTESAVNAIVSADSRGNIISWNSAACTVFGYKENEVLGKPLTLLMPERYSEAHQLGLDEVRSKGNGRVIGETVELKGLRKDGREFPLELSLGNWQSGGEMYFSAIIRDITERKRMERELIRYEKQSSVKELMEGMEDTLLNRLNLLGIHVSMILSKLESQGKDEQLESMRADTTLALDHCTLLARNVRRSTELLINVGDPVSLAELLSELPDSSGEMAVKVDAPDPVLALSVESKLSESFKEIVDNAQESGAKTLTISLRSDEEPGRIYITFRDDGAGMDDYALKEATTPFFTTKGTTKTGLGLWVASQMVEACGGTFELSSRPGEGTEVALSIPMLEQDSASGPEEDAHSLTAALSS